MSQYYVAVAGPGDGASAEAVADATAVGRLVAERGWVMLCGGRNAGVMAAAAAGASAAGGLTIGILPGSERTEASPALTVALATGLGEARNAVLVSTADAVIACGLNPGTLSEIGLALRASKPTALVRPSVETVKLLAEIVGGAPLYIAATPEDAVAWVGRQLSSEA
jgi:uncharacterized protein (TIGR00725 family)